MNSINLECPSCRTVLELDAGFGGGVCRCSACGTLMTVPAPSRNGGNKRPARLDRPDAPPTGRPATPQARSGSTHVPSPEAPPRAHRPEAPTQAPPTASSKSAAASKSPAPAKNPQDPSAPVAYGKSPPAHAASKGPRHPAARRLLAVVLVLLVAGVVVAVLALGGTAAFRGRAGRSVPSGNRGTTTAANPLLSQEANFLGVALEAQVAVVVEAGSAASRLLSFVQDALRWSIQRRWTYVKMQIIFAREGEASVFPDPPVIVADMDQAGLNVFFESVNAQGVANPIPAMGKALAAAPAQVVWLTTLEPTRYQLKQLGDQLYAHPKTRMDVIFIGSDSDAWRALAQRYGGTFNALPRERLLQWLREAQEASPNPPAP